MTVVGVVLIPEDETGSVRLDGTTLIDHAASALRGSGVVVSVLRSDRAGLLAALSEVDDAATVLLHDPRWPLAPASLAAAVVDAVAAGADAAVPVVEVTETVKEVDGAGRIVRTVPRETLRQVQYPRAFRLSALRSGDAVVRAVPGAPDSFAVRDGQEAELAAAVLAVRQEPSSRSARARSGR